MTEPASNIATITPNKGLVTKVAEKYGVDADKLLPALKQTAFKQGQGKEISNEQMMALLIVAHQYGLNPFTKEIFAFPDKGGIVPVVSVDGWSRIINENPNMDGIEFEYSPETVIHKGKTCHVWIDCIIHRKDRSKPTRAREFFAEVVRELSYSTPWDTHPNRMHRHKAEIQCARIAFGFAGIYDQDEAERIMENSRPEPSSPPLESYNEEQKKYYDQLISNSDKIGMYLFQHSIDEGVRNSLFNSFERGTITKYKGIVSSLYNEGLAQLQEIAEVIEGHASSDDLHGIAENLQGLSDEAVEWISNKVSSETSRMMREARSQV